MKLGVFVLGTSPEKAFAMRVMAAADDEEDADVVVLDEEEETDEGERMMRRSRSRMARSNSTSGHLPSFLIASDTMSELRRRAAAVIGISEMKIRLFSLQHPISLLDERLHSAGMNQLLNRKAMVEEDELKAIVPEIECLRNPLTSISSIFPGIFQRTQYSQTTNSDLPLHLLIAVEQQPPSYNDLSLPRPSQKPTLPSEIRTDVTFGRLFSHDKDATEIIKKELKPSDSSPYPPTHPPIVNRQKSLPQLRTDFAINAGQPLKVTTWKDYAIEQSTSASASATLPPFLSRSSTFKGDPQPNFLNTPFLPLVIQHPSEDIIQPLMSVREITDLVIKLGSLWGSVPSLFDQLKLQGNNAQLKLVGSATNDYAGVGQYWSPKSTNITLKGSLPLAALQKRLEKCCQKALGIQNYVSKAADIPLNIMNGIVTIYEDLHHCTAEMMSDFAADGGLMGILSSCYSWVYVGLDGARLTLNSFKPIWDMHEIILKVNNPFQMDAVEIPTNLFTPFATSYAAQVRAARGDVAGALQSILHYEHRLGSSGRVSGWIALREWGVCSEIWRAGQRIDPAWLASNRAQLGGNSYGGVSNGTRIYDQSLLLLNGHAAIIPSILGSTFQSSPWLLFAKAAAPLTLTKVSATLMKSLNANFGIIGGKFPADLLPDHKEALKRGHVLLGFHLTAYSFIQGVETISTRVSMLDVLLLAIKMQGSSAVLMACDCPFKLDKVTPQIFLDLFTLASHNMANRTDNAAFSSIASRIGKEEALKGLICVISLMSRMGGDASYYYIRTCMGGVLILDESLEHLLREQGAHTKFIFVNPSVSTTGVSSVIVCKGSVKGGAAARAIGIATFVGALAHSSPSNTTGSVGSDIVIV